MDIGEIVKNRRKELGITQQELAEGICAQALISRIEKGDIVSKKSILNKLEDRLGLNKNELSRLNRESDTSEEISQVKKTIRNYLTKRDYKTIELLLIHHQSLIDRISNVNDRVFFTWIKASLQHKLYNKADKALEILNNIPLDSINNELAIEIINAIGVIYYQDSDYDKAITIYQTGIDKIDESVNYQVQAKVMLNYALALEEVEKNKEALSFIASGIDLLVENNSLYLLGDYHHSKGQLFYKLGNLQEAKASFELSSSIFKLQSNNKLLSLSQLALTEINNLINN